MKIVDRAHALVMGNKPLTLKERLELMWALEGVRNAHKPACWYVVSNGNVISVGK